MSWARRFESAVGGAAIGLIVTLLCQLATGAPA